MGAEEAADIVDRHVALSSWGQRYVACMCWGEGWMWCGVGDPGIRFDTEASSMLGLNVRAILCDLRAADPADVFDPMVCRLGISSACRALSAVARHIKASLMTEGSAHGPTSTFAELGQRTALENAV